MTIDWDKFDQDLDGIIEEAAERTDEKLASKISSITRLTDEEIIELFPKPADAKKLFELMKIVKSAERQNTKINKIISNIDEFGKIIVPLLTKLT